VEQHAVRAGERRARAALLDQRLEIVEHAGRQVEQLLPSQKMIEHEASVDDLEAVRSHDAPGVALGLLQQLVELRADRADGALIVGIQVAREGAERVPLDQVQAGLAIVLVAAVRHRRSLLQISGCRPRASNASLISQVSSSIASATSLG